MTENKSLLYIQISLNAENHFINAVLWLHKNIQLDRDLNKLTVSADNFTQVIQINSTTGSILA